MFVLLRIFFYFKEVTCSKHWSEKAIANIGNKNNTDNRVTPYKGIQIMPDHCILCARILRSFGHIPCTYRPIVYGFSIAITCFIFHSAAPKLQFQQEKSERCASHPAWRQGAY